MSNFQSINNLTGIFTCPVDGLYYFTYGVYVIGSSSFGIELVLDDTAKTAAWADSDAYDQGWVGTILPCDKDNQVKPTYQYA